MIKTITLMVVAFMLLCHETQAQEIFFASSYPAKAWKKNFENTNPPEDITWPFNDENYTGLFVDGKNNHLYITLVDDTFEAKDAKIVRTDLNGDNGIILLDDSIDKAFAPCLDPENPQYLYFVNETLSFDYQIMRMDLIDYSLTTIWSPDKKIENFAIDFDADVLYFVQNYFDPVIKKINLSSGDFTPVDHLEDIVDYDYTFLAIDQSTKDLYFVMEGPIFPPNDFEQIRVLKNGASATEPVLNSPNSETIAGLVIDPDGKLYFNYLFEKNIISANLDGTNLNYVITIDDFSNPYEVPSFEFISVNNYFVSATSSIDKPTAIINIWPNPNNGHFKLSIASPESNKNYSIEIINQFGTTIHRNNFFGNQFSLDEFLASGIYFLKVFDSNQEMESIQKIVVQ